MDVDDREETVSKKIRDAGREWIPYVAVVGDTEVEKRTLSVTIREESSKEKQKVEMDVFVLKDLIESGINGKPFRQLPGSYKLSERAKFVGG